MTAPWASIPVLVEQAADRLSEHPALVSGEQRLTYGELGASVRTFAAALVRSGIEPGDRVAVWAPNSGEWVVAFLGLLAAGATLVPVNTRFKGREAYEVLSRSHAKALVTVTDFLETDYVDVIGPYRTSLPDLTVVVVAHGRTPDGAVAWGDFMARADDAAVDLVGQRLLALGRDDPSDILFTSGTTGTPKGVVMTHGRSLQIAADWVAMTGLCEEDRYLMVNPYFHMFGLKAGILACVIAGATMLPEPVFDVDGLLARVASERVTALPGAPTIYQAILDHPRRDDYDLSSLRLAVTGAADIPVELIRRVHEELPFSMIATGYGLTEAGTVTGTSAGDDFEAIATTVGRARPGFEIRVVDRDGVEVAPGEQGEILLRSPTVMLGYLDDLPATAAAVDAQGWLHTGDLGVLDQARRLRIVGRSKDMFIVGGFNAYPAEIENALLRHPEVVAAAVIGIPHDRLGEVGMAFVVLAGGATARDTDIVAWCREQMANYKAPRVVEIVLDLPLNAAGKVLKDELRSRAARPRAGV